MKDTVDLNQILAQAQQVAVDTLRTFGKLNVEQVNWKPSSERWSVGQCFEHLISSNKAFVPIIQSVIDGRKEKTVWQQIPGLPSLWGKLLVKSLDPASTRKLKAPNILQPSPQCLPSGIVNDFVEQQRRIVDQMKASADLNLRKIIITSPVSAFVTYSLYDAFRIIVVHEQRHFQQAVRVMQEHEFPN